MNRKPFDREERREVTKDELMGSLESVLLAPRGKDAKRESRTDLG